MSKHKDSPHCSSEQTNLSPNITNNLQNNNMHIHIEPADPSKKSSPVFKVLQYIVVPIIVAIIGCINYNIPNSTPEPSPPNTSFETPQPTSTPFETSQPTSITESLGEFEITNPDDIFNPITFCLKSNSTLDAQSYEETLKIIRSRLDAMCSPYAIEIDESVIWVIATRDAFGKNEMEVDATKYILAHQGGVCIGSKRLGMKTVIHSDIQDSGVYETTSEQTDEPEGYRLSITMSTSGKRKIIEIANDIQNNGGGLIDVGAIAFESQYTEAIVDGTNVQILFGCEQKSIMNLVSEVIGGCPLPSVLLVDGQESPLFYSHETTDIPENKVCFSFLEELKETDDQNAFSRKAFEDATRVLRYRMNALGLPFLVKVNNNEIIVETVPDHIGYEIIRLLGRKKSVELYPAMGPMILDMNDISSVYATSEGTKLSLTDEGRSKLLLSAYQTEDMDEARDYYLAINNVIISRLTMSLSELKQITNDKYFGALIFNKLLIHEQSEITKENFF